MLNQRIRELREKRAGLIEENRNILERIESDTSDEQTKDLQAEWDRRDAEIVKLSDQIDRDDRQMRVEYEARLEAEGRQPLNPERRSGREIPGLTSRAESGDRFRDMNTGREVRLFRGNERLADALAPDALRDSPMNIGEIAFRNIKGRWSHNEIAAEARAMQIGVDADGGFMVPEPISLQVIDYARAEARCMQAGVRTMVMGSATEYLSRIESDPTWSWKAEGSAGVSSQPTIGRVILNARTVQAIIPITGELWDDVSNLPQTLDHLIRASCASEIDRVILHGSENGSPSNEPQGLFGTSGINTYNYGGTVAGYSFVSQSVQKVQESNLVPNAMISHPKVYGMLDRLTDTLGQPLRPPQSFTDLARYSTTNVSTDEGSPSSSCAFVAKWDEVVLGTRLGLRLFTSREGATASDNAMTEFKLFLIAVMRVDVAVLRPAAVCVAQNLGLS